MRQTTTSPAANLIAASNQAVNDLCFLQSCAKISRQRTIDTLLAAIEDAKASTLLERFAQAVEALKDLHSGSWYPEADEWDAVMGAFYQELSLATGTTVTDQTDLTVSPFLSSNALG